jgi:DNA-binding NarL/FixJ family response regulator
VTRIGIVAAAARVRAQLEAVIARSASLTLSVAAASIDAILADARLASSEVLVVHVGATDLGAREIDVLPPIPIVALLRAPVVDGASARLLAFGIRGVLADDSTPEEIHAAIEAAVAGLVVVAAERVGELVRSRAAPPARDLGRSPEKADRIPSLTPREQEILGMLAEGLPNKVIASRLGISDHTVKTHLEAVFGKLGASTRAEAVARAVRAGLLLL